MLCDSLSLRHADTTFLTFAPYILSLLLCSPPCYLSFPYFWLIHVPRHPIIDLEWPGSLPRSLLFFLLLQVVRTVVLSLYLNLL